MKVSVVIPTFNRAGLIGDAIESVLRQTMSDFEIVVVDDGSTDGTSEALEPYSGRVRYIRTANRGPSHARNIGMRAAGGNYIAFLDSDDLYYPWKLEIQSGLLDDHPEIAMVCSEFSAFDDQGYWDEYHLKKYHRPGYEGGSLTYDKIFSEKVRLSGSLIPDSVCEDAHAYFGHIFETYYNYQILCTNTMLFRREILEKIGYQNEGYRLMEEHDFALRLTKYYKVAFIDIPTYKLRYHAGQISDVTRSPSRTDGLDITIEKQRTKLLTALELGFDDRQYYFAHKDMVDRRLDVLRKALAIPLMCRNGGANEARTLLRSSRLGRKREYLLLFATYFPTIVRKASVKLHNLLPAR